MSLHWFLVQWVDDNIEVVHADTSTCIATADAPLLVGHAGMSCLTGVDLANFVYISCTKEGFIPISLKPIDTRLNILM